MVHTSRGSRGPRQGAHKAGGANFTSARARLLPSRLPLQHSGSQACNFKLSAHIISPHCGLCAIRHGDRARSLEAGDLQLKIA